MTLSGSQYQQVRDALLSSYTQAELGELVRIYLEIELEHVAGGENLTEVVSSLIRWAGTVGETEALIKAACADNPENPDLQILASDLDRWLDDPIGLHEKRTLEEPLFSPKGRQTKILFLAVNSEPIPSERARDGGASIGEFLSKTRYRDEIGILAPSTVVRANLQGLLLEEAPEIVHLSNMGNPADGIRMKTADGNIEEVNPYRLADNFYKCNVQCVVLEACMSVSDATAFGLKVGPVVVVAGNNEKFARCFLQAFYRAIGYGNSLRAAYDLGVSDIEFRDLSKRGRLRLIPGAVNPHEITFVGPQRELPADDASASEMPEISHRDRQRLIMLGKVDTRWIRDVLERSFKDKFQLDLQFESWNDTLKDPTSYRSNHSEPEYTTLNAYSGIGSIFDASDGALLVLGEPGSGKSMQLLWLAKESIDRAYLDATCPIPVVLQLASWAANPLPLSDWVAVELNEKYGMPSDVASKWAANRALFLLLDGLDEVDDHLRADCVRAINAYRKEYQNPVVVCCRAADYLSLDQKLRFGQAIYIQPLTSLQADQYLNEVGVEDAGIHDLLQSDPDLLELARTPLLLDILSTSYQNVPSSADAAAGAVADADAAAGSRRDEVLSAYVDTMYQRRTNGRYGRAQMDDWLNWLARGLVDHSQTEFLIEQLQPTWLLTSTQRLLYNIGTRIAGALVLFLCALFAGLIAGLFLPDPVEIIRRGSLIGFLLMAAFLISSILRFRLPSIVAVAIAMVLTGTLVFVIPLSDEGGSIIAGILVGLVFGLPGGLAGVSMASTTSIVIYDKLKLSWPKAALGVVISIALAVAVSVLFYMSLDGNSIGPTAKKAIELTLDLWMILTPTFTLLLALSRSQKIEPVLRPNQGIRHSASNALMPALAVVIFSVVAAAIVSIITQRPWLEEVGAGLILGLPVGVVIGIRAGGASCIQHYVLRILLRFFNQLPLNIQSVLDEAADRAFLYRAGGAYLFVHRLIREHFLELEDFSNGKQRNA